MQQESSPKILYWEDVVVGSTVGFGRKVVSKEEIVAFARAFDPQPFHLDEDAAKETLIGHLFASGWHTCAMFMRMLAEDVLSSAAGLGAPGVDEVRWLKPVSPGDEITARYTCTAKRALKSRPGVGLCQVLFEVFNQHGDLVMTLNAPQLLRMRSAGGAE